MGSNSAIFGRVVRVAAHDDRFLAPKERMPLGRHVLQVVPARGRVRVLPDGNMWVQYGKPTETVHLSSLHRSHCHSITYLRIPPSPQELAPRCLKMLPAIVLMKQSHFGRLVLVQVEPSYRSLTL